MAVNTTSVLTSAMTEFYDKNLLVRAAALLVHDKFGQMRSLPQKSSGSVKFRRYTNLTKATIPLVEGVSPTGQSLAVTDITATPLQYGSYIEYSDVVSMINPDPLLTEIGSLLAQNAAESVDAVYRDAISAGSSYYRAGNVTNRSDIALKLTAAELKIIVRRLELNKARYYNDKPIAGSARVGTTPVPSSYYAIIDPYTEYDLVTILAGDYIPVHKYPDPSVAVEGEVGCYQNKLRFIMTTEAKVWPDAGGSAVAAGLSFTTANTACDVHTMLIFGKDAYGIIPLNGNSLQNIVKPLGAGDDPLNQRATSGWKAYTTAKILNDTFMYRYEFGVSA